MNNRRALISGVIIGVLLVTTMLFSQGNGTNSNPLSVMRVQGVSGGTAAPVTAAGAAANGATLSGNPLEVAVSDGANAVIPQICDKFVALSTSTSGLLQIIALSSSTVIRVCHISIATTAPEDFQLSYGTGTNCGTTDVVMTGLYKSVQSFDLSFPFGSPLKTIAAQELCVNQSAAQAIGITILYGQN